MDCSRSPRVYQVRGFDLANMTLIEGKTGWIIVDPLTTPETARAALALANKSLGAHPVSAVVITHSHIDHFGGILGVLTREQQQDSTFPIYAPEGFLEEATSENILVGLAMGKSRLHVWGICQSTLKDISALVWASSRPTGEFGLYPKSSHYCSRRNTNH